MMTNRARESLRLQYKPLKVRWLFIGESPPANGTFFYKADSNLSRYTQKAFSTAFEAEFADGQEFLDFFKAQGCYLIDLCNHPSNHFPRPKRNRERKECAVSLPGRMAEYSPRGIIVVMKGIARYVKSSLDQADLAAVPLYTLPFPAMGNQHRYVESLVAVLNSLKMNREIE